MSWSELGDSLFDLVSGIVEPVADGVVVTEADLSVPLEIQLGRRADRLVLFAQPPHSRWRSGFLPATHMSRLTITLRSGDGR
jgi:hypothetical protein